MTLKLGKRLSDIAKSLSPNKKPAANNIIIEGGDNSFDADCDKARKQGEKGVFSGSKNDFKMYMESLSSA